MGLGVGGWEVRGLKKGKRESVEGIKPLSFEEQDPEPLPPTGHGRKKTGKTAKAYRWEGMADVGPDAQMTKHQW